MSLINQMLSDLETRRDVAGDSVNALSGLQAAGRAPADPVPAWGRLAFAAVIGALVACLAWFALDRYYGSKHGVGHDVAASSSSADRKILPEESVQKEKQDFSAQQMSLSSSEA